MRSSPRFIFGRLKAEVRWCPAMADRLQGLVAEEWLSECSARAAEGLSQVSPPKVRMGPAPCKTVGSALQARRSSPWQRDRYGRPLGCYADTRHETARNRIPSLRRSL
jgi:hypothetical protein